MTQIHKYIEIKLKLILKFQLITMCVLIPGVTIQPKALKASDLQASAPTNGLGVLDTCFLLRYFSPGNGLGALSHSFKTALKMGALQNSCFEACSIGYWASL